MFSSDRIIISHDVQDKNICETVPDPGESHRRPPPTGPSSFIFAYIFTEKHPHRRLAHHQRVGAPQQEILNPPLIKVLNDEKL